MFNKLLDLLLRFPKKTPRISAKTVLMHTFLLLIITLEFRVSFDLKFWSEVLETLTSVFAHLF